MARYPFVPAAAAYGPRAGPVRAFLVHMAEGGGTVGYLAGDPARGVSVHYVVEYSGRVVQMVAEDHATGSVNPNDLRTTDDPAGPYGYTAARVTMGSWWRDPNAAVISCEVEGFARDGPNSSQAAALTRLVADVRTRFPSMGLLGHRDFQDYKPCPGRLIPWSALGGHGPRSEAPTMPGLTITELRAAAGTVTVKNIQGVQAVQVDDPSQRFAMPPGTRKETVAIGRLAGDPLGADTGPVGSAGDRHTVRLVGDELAVLLAGQVDYLPAAPPAPAPATVELKVNGATVYKGGSA